MTANDDQELNNDSNSNEAAEYEHPAVVKTSKVELKKLKPIEAINNYRKYLERATSAFPRSSLCDFNKTEECLEHLRSVVVQNDPKTMSDINMIMQNFLKESKSQNNVVRSENRFTRNMRKTVKSDDYEKLRYQFENSTEALGKRLQIDLSECLPLHYEERIFFNPRFSPYTKLKICILPFIFRFLLKVSHLKLEEHHHFRLMLQNFVLCLNYSPSPIEIYGTDTKICKESPYRSWSNSPRSQTQE